MSGGLSGSATMSLGSYSLSYPVTVDAQYADAVTDGELITIDTSDYSVSGAQISLSGPAVQASATLSTSASVSLSVGRLGSAQAAVSGQITLSPTAPLEGKYRQHHDQ